MDTVSLYLAIKVIHSSCYIADLFTIAPTAHSEANKLLKQRQISPPNPISRFSNYMWNVFALPADPGGHCTIALTHTNAPPQFQESYKPWKTGWQCLRLFLSTGRCRCLLSTPYIPSGYCHAVWEYIADTTYVSWLCYTWAIAQTFTNEFKSRSTVNWDQM